MKILTVVGARPQFIKAAPVSHAFSRRDAVEEVLVHTGQHFDANMSAIFFAELGIPAPRYHLDVHGGGHGDMTGRMLMSLEPVMVAERPDLVLVYGDTNSTLAASLCAAKLKLPVAHVEAGLRSFNRHMPEEINRILTDHLSSWLFCPTKAAVANLNNEGIGRGVHQVGDVMFDATLAAADRASTRDTLSRLGLTAGDYVLATIHRAENTDDPLRLQRILNFLRLEAEDITIVMPLHPRTVQAARASHIGLEAVHVTEPIGYLDMTKLLSECRAVYTDSGGVQKEAYFHRKPCVTLRDETEWVETVECGWNRLWTSKAYAERREINEYGDGHAAAHIVDVLLSERT